MQVPVLSAVSSHSIVAQRLWMTESPKIRQAIGVMQAQGGSSLCGSPGRSPAGGLAAAIAAGGDRLNAALDGRGRRSRYLHKGRWPMKDPTKAWSQCGRVRARALAIGPQVT